MKLIAEVKVMEANKNYWIKVDGHIFEVEPGNGSTFTLEELQSAVGGFVEFVQVPGYYHIKRRDRNFKSRAIVCNDEGKLRSLPLNKLASDLAFDQLKVWDFICGDVLYVDSDTLV